MWSVVVWTDCSAYCDMSWPVPTARLWTGPNQHHEWL